MARTCDLIGKKFGELVVLEKTDERKYNGQVVWKCKCGCGNICYVSTNSLNKGNTTSCGHKNKYNLKNKKFGKLFVISESNKKIRNNGTIERTWKCKCSCGNICHVTSYDLKSGHTKSCGCLKKSRLGKETTTHGMSKIKEYRIWVDMKKRCNNENNIGYKNYGGRGIKVCKRWDISFENFLDDMGRCPKGYSLERKDVNGNYCKENCIWIKKSDQQKNTRKSVIIKYDGKIMILSDWARFLGVSVQYLHYKLRIKKLSMDKVVKELKNV